MKIKLLRFFLFIYITFFLINYLIKGNILNLNLLKISLIENKELILLSFLFYIMAIFTNALRFKYVLNKFNIKINFQQIFSAQILGIFFGQFLFLSGFFIEAIKIYFLSKYYNFKKWLKISYCTLFDKLLGLSSFFLLSSLFSLLYYTDIKNFFKNNLLLSIFFFLISIILIIIPKIINFFKIKNLNYNFAYGKEILISLLSSFFFTLSFYCIFLAINQAANFYMVSTSMPLIVLSFLLPLGYMGLGGYQFAAIYIFSFFQTNQQTIAHVSITFALITFIINSTFGIYYIIKNFSLLRKIFNKVMYKKS